MARAECVMRRNRTWRRIYGEDASRKAGSRNFRSPMSLKSDAHPATTDRDRRGGVISDHFREKLSERHQGEYADTVRMVYAMDSTTQVRYFDGVPRRFAPEPFFGSQGILALNKTPRLE